MADEVSDFGRTFQNMYVWEKGEVKLILGNINPPLSVD